MKFLKKLFGTPKYKLHKKDAPDTSIEAAGTLNTKKLEEAVYDAIAKFGTNGCIQDDILGLPQFRNTPYSSVTARFRALLDKEFVFDSGERRIGKSGKKQRVLVANTVNRGN